MAWIEKRRGTFRVRWFDIEERQLSRKCPDKKTAQRVKQEIERALAEGRDWEPEGVRGAPALEEVLMAYIESMVRAKAPSSVRKYAGNLDLVLRWLRQRYGDGEIPLRVLNKKLLEDLYDDLLRDGLHGRPRGVSTVVKIVAVFERAWAWAYNEDEYSRWVPPPKWMEMPEEPQDPVVAPTWAEMDACVAAARGWVRQLAILLRFLGVRVAQAMWLRWDDFDFEAATLRIRGELGKSRHERRGRIIPVSRHLVDEMRGWKRHGEFVVHYPGKQDGPQGREARGRDMRRAWKRAEIREEVWRQRPNHSFRKGFKSQLTGAGAPWEAVEHLLGHQVGDNTTARYLDPKALRLRDAVDLIPPLGQHMVLVEESRG